jgi:hypothetical protein
MEGGLPPPCEKLNQILAQRCLMPVHLRHFGYKGMPEETGMSGKRIKRKETKGSMRRKAGAFRRSGN